ncbi:hypothetical protein FISHEDRAFT_61540 [Fistulina hepatica ATCC 64428]|uniref:Uncharacterized protein n=1 Tax=Fistulina hepatica ATCC 64428 TaxID=1128425 RepID=A0A0D7A230_9AGAR|nr:hypothetical protein FISHEDRAFT_61540 [Fistulina hepatica ATCC 64428]
MPSAPLFLIRLVIYTLAFAWGAIALAVAINAFVKQHQLENDAKSLVSAEGITLDFDTKNLFNPGVAVTVFCALTLTNGALACIALFIRRTSSTTALKIQGAVFAFLAIALFATHVPTTNAIANDTVGLVAKSGNTVLSPSLVQSLSASLGYSLYYKDQNFLIWLAVMPWIAFLFVVLASIVSFLAASRVLPPEAVKEDEEAAVVVEKPEEEPARGSTEKSAHAETESKKSNDKTSTAAKEVDAHSTS